MKISQHSLLRAEQSNVTFERESECEYARHVLKWNLCSFVSTTTPFIWIFINFFRNKSDPFTMFSRFTGWRMQSSLLFLDEYFNSSNFSQYNQHYVFSKSAASVLFAWFWHSITSLSRCFSSPSSLFEFHLIRRMSHTATIDSLPNLFVYCFVCSSERCLKIWNTH